MEKQQSMTSPRIIISGGGTGGHIYPAIAIADEIKVVYPNAKILFVGAKGKMEMEKVPKNGYEIKGLNIAGFDRHNFIKNLTLPFKLISSLFEANKIIKKFKPNIIIGTGGYASGSVLFLASIKKIPFFIQEQNSFPGKTNSFLAKKAKKIFVAYDGLEKFFPKEKIHLTGNPIRAEIFSNLPNKEQAREKLGLEKNKFTILSVGGSQGARAINEAWVENITKIKSSSFQLLWQTGKLDYTKIISDKSIQSDNIKISEFIYNMQDAYAAADLIVSRSGAIAISELMLVGKPCIFIPLPSAAEDHQTKNTLNLTEKNAAVMIKNNEVKRQLLPVIEDLINDIGKQKYLGNNLRKLAKPNATKEIVKLIFQK
jgi:UDP-N-acetylglucosamine--N-acetylmuramyl-(pentapeptide) pyrophosphoryl-undecaprenol N-acetylglucosamine transferase